MDVSDTLEELPVIVGKMVCLNLLVFVYLHKVLIFEDIACVVVDDGGDEVNGGVRGWEIVSRRMLSAVNAYPQ
jgi:hypothetical protein